jgi:hypothetical protein
MNMKKSIDPTVAAVLASHPGSSGMFFYDFINQAYIVNSPLLPAFLGILFIAEGRKIKLKVEHACLFSIQSLLSPKKICVYKCVACKI